MLAKFLEKQAAAAAALAAPVTSADATTEATACENQQTQPAAAHRGPEISAAAAGANAAAKPASADVPAASYSPPTDQQRDFLILPGSRFLDLSAGCGLVGDKSTCRTSSASPSSHLETALVSLSACASMSSFWQAWACVTVPSGSCRAFVRLATQCCAVVCCLAFRNALDHSAEMIYKLSLQSGVSVRCSHIQSLQASQRRGSEQR